jgi:hypothetical protein
MFPKCTSCRTYHGLRGNCSRTWRASCVSARAVQFTQRPSCLFARRLICSGVNSLEALTKMAENDASNSFRSNTYDTPRKCCKQKTYGTVKSFRCNTYKKHRGWGSLWLTRVPFGVECGGLPPLFFTPLSAPLRACGKKAQATGV